MNYLNNLKIMGKVFLVEAGLMLFPIIVALVYQEPFSHVLAFLVPIAILGVLGTLSQYIKPKEQTILPRDGFFIVVFSWLIISIIGALPFIISGDIPSFVDAFFEITSGFTTTGASILARVEDLSHSSLFWRSFSHWIGGMGILVFILAVMPRDRSGNGSTMHVLETESPGPQVGKLVSKMSVTTRILYAIYIAMTAVLIILLVLDPGVDFFTSFCLAFGTAGTGGFAVTTAGIASYSPYVQYLIAIFMILFGVNFTLYYLILIKKWRQALHNEELYTYLGIIVLATVIISVVIYRSCATLYPTAESAFRNAFFQVSSIITTTGFAITDTAAYWPSVCQWILVLLMVSGAMAGSTGGGLKVSRVIILGKSLFAKIKKEVNPRRVVNMKQDGQVISAEMESQVLTFFFAYTGLIALVTLVISFDGFDLLSNFTAALGCVSNVGPGLGMVGPYGNFAAYSGFSKIVLALSMIAGRLEVLPVFILFYPRTWSKI